MPRLSGLASGTLERTSRFVGPTRGRAHTLFKALWVTYPSLPEMCRREWPGCHDISQQIAAWLKDRGVPHKLVQGYFDGGGEQYHWWVEAQIGRESWIIDGARRQFHPREPDLLMRRKDAHEHEYVLMPTD